MSFDHNGIILQQAICARNIGTTVSITDFFITLPVRRGEFMKHYKKDFAKMVQLLQEYCLVLTGVKILCTNIPQNGGRQTVISTNGHSVIENIISVFGAKQSKLLTKIIPPTEDGTEEGTYTQQSLADLEEPTSLLDIKTNDLDKLNLGKFRIDGLISNIEHNAGRSSKDRQYFYVNSRPVEPKSIIKLVNEVYRRYNMHQFPFVFLNLKMDQSDVDVNLTPDKRQVLVNNEKILQLVVKRALMNTFGDQPSLFKTININVSVKNHPQNDISDEEEDESENVIGMKPGNKFGEALMKWRKNPNEDVPPKQGSKRKSNTEKISKSQQSCPKIDRFFAKQSSDVNKSKWDDLEATFSQIVPKSPTRRKSNVDEAGIDRREDADYIIDCKAKKPENTLIFEVVSKKRRIENLEDFNDMTNVEKSPVSMQVSESSFIELIEESEVQKGFNFTEPSLPDFESTRKKIITEPVESQTSLKSRMKKVLNTTVKADKCKPKKKCVKVTLEMSIEKIKELTMMEEEAIQAEELIKKSKMKLRFKERIDPSKNKNAEAELSTELKKEMFKEMKIIGQFNLGFILVLLNEHLFIVDQHASDEKYNFETLQKSLILQHQPLVIPEKLQLTAINELVLIDNLAIMELNGFKFHIDDNAPPTMKIKLTSKPQSKNIIFGAEDIDELLFMLQEAPNTVCRPSRIRTMLASRACRKSVMIGDPLTKKLMKNLVTHMGEIEHPWNCPHGRPTIRYLANLDLIEK